MKQIKLKYLILFISFFVSSCMLSFGVKEYDTNSVDLKVMKERISKNYEKINSLKASFEFSYTTTRNRLQSSGFLYFSGKDTLYVEINGAVGETEAVFFLSEDSIKAANYIQKVFINDKANENSFNRVTGINLTAKKFRESLYGYENITSDIIIVKRDELSIELKKIITPNEYKIIKLNKKLLIEEIYDYKDDSLIIRKEYDYFYELNGTIIPKRIRIRTYDPKTKLTIFYNRVDINKEHKIDFRMTE
ncbi:MAG: DUF4292 domain-containing protein [Candidatus Delongbacteria bacterium]|jgi:hypothetical protein|nr:DUF4292 domain-containing protein [Candidatus Delongbacteria bacterium]